MYTVQEFTDAISSKEGLPLPTSVDGVSVIGLAKAADSGSKVITFSFGTTCNARWFQIPESLIEGIDHIGKMSCYGHEYDLVAVHFKAPKTPESIAYVEVVKRLTFEGTHRVSPSPSSAALPTTDHEHPTTKAKWDYAWDWSGGCSVKCTNGQCQWVCNSGLVTAFSIGDARIQAENQMRFYGSRFGMVIEGSIQVTVRIHHFP